MTFNSWDFIVFFLCVYALYLMCRRSFRLQNIILLVTSYVFYGYWDYRFLSLLLITTVMDYAAALGMTRATTQKTRKAWLVLSLVGNLTLLGTFKYFNFFIAGFAKIVAVLGFQADVPTLYMLLPVGISFYTFQTISYTMDVYRGNLRATRNFLDFALFISFFPHLVAGPLTRGSNLLQQISKPRQISASNVQAAIFLIVWGYFKKMAIADNAGALLVDPVFQDLWKFQGINLVFAALGFGLQIYGDFSGYTDIGRGIAQLMGFHFPLNFNLPYWAASPREFWNRWHITLSSWFRDYLYIPLGGNRHGEWTTCRNLLITMGLAGLWHGASWNFLLWGFYHGVLLIAGRILETHYKVECPRAFAIPVMLVLTTIGWIFFRCRSTNQLMYFMSHMSFRFSADSYVRAYQLIVLATPIVLMEYWQNRKSDLLALTKTKPVYQIAVYALLLVGIAIFKGRDGKEFIYFQF